MVGWVGGWLVSGLVDRSGGWMGDWVGGWMLGWVVGCKMRVNISKYVFSRHVSHVFQTCLRGVIEDAKTGVVATRLADMSDMSR